MKTICTGGMTKKELLEMLAEVPDDAIIYVEAKRRQLPEQASSIKFARETSLSLYGNHFRWFDGLRPRSLVTAVLIE